MKKLLTIALLMCAIVSFTGCRSQKFMETTHIVHDSVYLKRDSIVIRFVKDSVSEREKTTIQTKHDSITGRDTVFVQTDRIVERWKLRVDTVSRLVYVDKNKTTEDTKKKETKKTGAFDTEGLIFFVLLVVWLIGFIYIRLKK
jgi:hypothetical protein